MFEHLLVHPGIGDPRATKNVFRAEINCCLKHGVLPQSYWYLGRCLSGDVAYVTLPSICLTPAERRAYDEVARWHAAGRVIVPADVPADVHVGDWQREPVDGDRCQGCGGEMIAVGVLCAACDEMRAAGLRATGRAA